MLEGLLGPLIDPSARGPLLTHVQVRYGVHDVHRTSPKRIYATERKSTVQTCILSTWKPHKGG